MSIYKNHKSKIASKSEIITKSLFNPTIIKMRQQLLIECTTIIGKYLRLFILYTSYFFFFFRFFFILFFSNFNLYKRFPYCLMRKRDRTQKHRIEDQRFERKIVLFV